MVRRGGEDTGYLVAVRQAGSGNNCGIYEKTAPGLPGAWTPRVLGDAKCKIALGSWHVLGVRVTNGSSPDRAELSMLSGTVI